MSGLIGGSGSTGSSLLRQILNRHSQIFCGPETSLFCKPQLFDDWANHKSQILKRGIRGLRSNSWHVYRGTDLLKEEIGLSAKEIQSLITSSGSFKLFVESFFGEILQRKRKSFWLEKTPGNAFNFQRFNNSFSEGKLIHITRSPYDSTASLFKRGFSHFQATAIYLLNTSFALSANDMKDYHLITYEELVQDPKLCISALCDFLGFQFEENMLSANKEAFKDEPTQIGKWTYDESAGIGKGSIGNFEKLTIEDQEILKYAMDVVRIDESILNAENLKHKSIEELCHALNYPYNKDKIIRHKQKLVQQKKKDQFIRLKKMAYYNVTNYPIRLIAV